MRETAFEVFNKPTTAPEVKPEQSHRVNLFERLQRKPEPKPEEEKKTTEEKTETSTENKTGEQTTAEEPTVTIENDKDDYEKFKDGVADTFEDYIDNPEEFVEMLLGFVDIGRIIFLPGIYEGLAYPGNERNDIRDIVRRSIENEKANKARDEGFSNYEKRLFGKWDTVQETIRNVGYSADDYKLLVKVFAKRIKTMTIGVWMAKYDWIIALIYVEARHAKSLGVARATDMIQKKFGA